LYKNTSGGGAAAPAPSLRLVGW